MKKIKDTEHKPNCKWCWPQNNTPAVWRGNGLGATVKHACEKHRPELEAHEKKHRDNGEMSEGDEQSWGRL